MRCWRASKKSRAPSPTSCRSGLDWTGGTPTGRVARPLWDEPPLAPSVPQGPSGGGGGSGGPGDLRLAPHDLAPARRAAPPEAPGADRGSDRGRARGWGVREPLERRVRRGPRRRQLLAPPRELEAEGGVALGLSA